MRKLKEFVIEGLIFLSGITTIIFVVLIFAFLLKESFSFFKQISFKDFFFGHSWYPISDPAKFGILPLILGSLFVTCGALLIA
ncbi:MAG: phosphate ABC transporter permease subunit PstC, partial [Candidatus Omnitrophota bacterium]|nr:phosphate ABC transporter permease subunit PstC [Candidatus Omnitrophota bacterium]